MAVSSEGEDSEDESLREDNERLREENDHLRKQKAKLSAHVEELQGFTSHLLSEKERNEERGLLSCAIQSWMEIIRERSEKKAQLTRLEAARRSKSAGAPPDGPATLCFFFAAAFLP